MGALLSCVAQGASPQKLFPLIQRNSNRQLQQQCGRDKAPRVTCNHAPFPASNYPSHNKSAPPARRPGPPKVAKRTFSIWYSFDESFESCGIYWCQITRRLSATFLSSHSSRKQNGQSLLEPPPRCAPPQTGGLEGPSEPAPGRCLPVIKVAAPGASSTLGTPYPLVHSCPGGCAATGGLCEPPRGRLHGGRVQVAAAGNWAGGAVHTWPSPVHTFLSLPSSVTAWQDSSWCWRRNRCIHQRRHGHTAMQACREEGLLVQGRDASRKAHLSSG